MWQKEIFEYITKNKAQLLAPFKQDDAQQRLAQFTAHATAHPHVKEEQLLSCFELARQPGEDLQILDQYHIFHPGISKIAITFLRNALDVTQILAKPKQYSPHALPEVHCSVLFVDLQPVSTLDFTLCCD